MKTSPRQWVPLPNPMNKEEKSLIGNVQVMEK